MKAVIVRVIVVASVLAVGACAGSPYTPPYGVQPVGWGSASTCPSC